MNIILPWPPTGLSPNARLHWAKLARLKKQYRAVCAGQARIQGARAISATRLHLILEFVPPTRRAFDLDNALARMKSGLDGLADVLKVDDSRWELTIRKAPAGTIGGFVLVGVEVMTQIERQASGFSPMSERTGRDGLLGGKLPSVATTVPNSSFAIRQLEPSTEISGNSPSRMGVREVGALLNESAQADAVGHGRPVEGIPAINGGEDVK